VCDLTGLQPRIAARIIGIYWKVLFAFLRCLISLKHRMFEDFEMPRLRKCVLTAARFLNRLPTCFTKR